MSAKGCSFSRSCEKAEKQLDSENASSNWGRDEPSIDEKDIDSVLDNVWNETIDPILDQKNKQEQLERISVLRGAGQMVSCKIGALVVDQGRLVTVELPTDVEQILDATICGTITPTLFKETWSKFATESDRTAVRDATWDEVLSRAKPTRQLLLTGMDMAEISTFLCKFVDYAERHNVGIKENSGPGVTTQWEMLKQLSKLCAQISAIPREGGTVHLIMQVETQRLLDSSACLPFLFPVYGRSHIAYLVVQRWTDAADHEMHETFIVSVCNGGMDTELFSQEQFSHQTGKSFRRRGHCIVHCTKDEVEAFTSILASEYGYDNIFVKLGECISSKVADETNPAEKWDEKDLYAGRIWHLGFQFRQVFLVQQIVGNCAIHNLLQALKVFVPELFPEYDENDNVLSGDAEYFNAVMHYNMFEVCIGMVQENRKKHAVSTSSPEEKREDVMVEAILLPFLCEKMYTIAYHTKRYFDKDEAKKVISKLLGLDIFSSYQAEVLRAIKIIVNVVLAQDYVSRKLCTHTPSKFSHPSYLFYYLFAAEWLKRMAESLSKIFYKYV